ncbi:hypothetical protein EVAR_70586_1 [Eumeta japonica]|uniref:Uncharacterized protein n=1 Tax=Eumeta variegata TaxID=151549 RepID=A0A4C1T258_EUMVA|nr:hypothetical protein EVAR_70586_1 [Eumeta japonica]
MTPASNASSLPSSSESPVWKNQMSQQEFTGNNSRDFINRNMVCIVISLTIRKPKLRMVALGLPVVAMLILWEIQQPQQLLLLPPHVSIETNQMDQLECCRCSGFLNNATNGGVLNYNKIKNHLMITKNLWILSIIL